MGDEVGEGREGGREGKPVNLYVDGMYGMAFQQFRGQF